MCDSRLFPNAKEITESMAVFDAYRRFLAVSTRNLYEMILIWDLLTASEESGVLFRLR